MKKKLKLWAIVDKSEKPPRIFCGVEGNFHIFRTKKEADKWIDKQFFPAKKMGWVSKSIFIIS